MPEHAVEYESAVLVALRAGGHEPALYERTGGVLLLGVERGQILGIRWALEDVRRYGKMQTTEA